MGDRRSTYFAFQGLFMAVLLLLFLYQSQSASGWVHRFLFLALALGFSLTVLSFASRNILASWWFQAAVFIGDSALASLVLQWGHSRSETYLIYLLIIFGTALTRNLAQSFFVGLISSLLYMLTAWDPYHGFPSDPGFWLRVIFLLITTVLLAILSRDTHKAETDRDSKYRERLVQFERLATLGQVAGEVAHSIKGPLTTIMVNAEVLSHRYEKLKDLVREIEQIRHEAGRCKEILKNLLDMGRIEDIDYRRMDLREALQSALDAVRPQIEKYGLQLRVDGMDRPAPVNGDPSLLHEAFAAVLQNAVDAVGPQSPRKRQRERLIWVHLEPARRERRWLPRWTKNLHSLTIEDNGQGIDSKDFERIFQPFFTTKKSEGTGLGLSAALRILQKHGGSIEADSKGLGQGARFTLTLPLAAARRLSGTPLP